MVGARGETSDGKQLLILGLQPENLDRLRAQVRRAIVAAVCGRPGSTPALVHPAGATPPWVPPGVQVFAARTEAEGLRFLGNLAAADPRRPVFAVGYESWLELARFWWPGANPAAGLEPAAGRPV